MSAIVIDRETLAKLRELRDRTEFRDESGQTLGYFLPVPSRDRSLYEGVDAPISEEELERRARERGGRTLAEIMADLEKRS